VRVDVTPGRASVGAGLPAVVAITVVNTGEVIGAYRVTVLGVDRSWVELDRDEVQLFPEAAETVTAVISLPKGVPAGIRRVSIQVTELTPPGAIELVEVEIDVAPESAAHIDLDPVSISGGRSTAFGTLVRNQGNTPLILRLTGTDAEGDVRFEFDPPIVQLEPGAEHAVAGKMRARRPLAGTPRVRAVTVSASGVDPPPQAIGTFIQRPLFTRGALSLLGLLGAVSIFAIVIASALGAVISRSEKDRSLLLEVVQQQTGAGAGRDVPGSIAGSVVDLTSQEPISGVTVGIYSTDDLVRPVVSGATNNEGQFRLDGLGAAAYKIQFTSAGFVETWYPNATDPADGDEVEVAPGELTELGDARLGGVPASVAGTVLGDDPAGAVLTLQLPGTTSDPGPDGAVIATTVADASGEFAFEGVPSPSTYELAVTKEGFTREAQVLDLSAGEERSGVEILLRLGDGSITGTVSDGNGPIGGVEIVATDGGSTESRTVSLTQDPLGGYTLRDLPTPATYTLTFSKDGYTSETVQVTLAAEQRGEASVVLQGGSGSISGKVDLAGAGAAGGVTVSASDGELTVQTTTVSVGAVGTYEIGGLPVPGTYTVTFSRPDLEPQTRQVDLDPFGGRDRPGTDALLRSATATLHGTVFEQVPGKADRGVGGVLVLVTSGDRTYRTITSTTPAGQFEIGGIVPGTYTVTFSRTGSVPISQLVTLAAGDRTPIPTVTITERASINGRVTLGNTGKAASRVTVRLYRASEYPGGEVKVQVTDREGRFRFLDLDAPESWVLDVAATASGAPTASATALSSAGKAVTVTIRIPQ
jgi:5-hydroxyisourate hydrolase-like protein (transthyretin family)